ncbi:DNA-directed RNA polymerase subunit beta [bacterium]|nr:DNA-directed RNA polymerase subunit beta [bacterium]
MASFVNHLHRPRKNFSKINKVIDVPNLIDIQKRSYERFLQIGVPEDQREDIGLQAVFKSVFPIKDFNETASLEFVSYKLEEPKYDVDECLQRGMTYACPVRVVVRLVVWDTSEGAPPGAIRDVKEQEVYFGEIPLMTGDGTFINNGTERVVVSQLHRSPGVFFESASATAVSRSNVLYSARMLPYRGSWLDFEYDHRDVLYVRIDRRRKMPATILLRALGYSEEDLLNFFYKSETVSFKGKDIFKSVVLDLLPGQMASFDVKDPKSGEVLVKAGKKFTKFSLKRLERSNIDAIKINAEDIIGRFAAKDVVNKDTGEVILGVNQELTAEIFDDIKTAGIESFDLLYIDGVNVNAALRNTLMADKMSTQDESILEIYSRLRPGEPPTLETATAYFESLFFNPDRYDLSHVGRLKINHKFGFDTELETRTLQKEDILHSVKYLSGLKDGLGVTDDIDHLGNRRVRTVGELVEIQYRIGLVRMERAIKERMSLQDVETLMPHELINSKPVSAVVKEFFSSSQLSQFMDQTNPLSSTTHKRRLSALGPGGLTRERAGFEVRDVHTTHYGRICPIETPEGPNIGLITSLSTFARVNDYGFIETPYRKVVNGVVTDEVNFYSALEEEKHIIAQANAPINAKGKFTGDLVQCRQAGETISVDPAEVTLMDVSPNQLVSVAASLIPFLENDDANRALMGSNMQRQAVPLLSASAPIVGTGMESIVARDSGAALVAVNDGVVESVDAGRIVIRSKAGSKVSGPEVDIYNLVKYQRSNQATCVNQKPIVRKGDEVLRGQVIADGPSTSKGELALGKNVIVAFMPWQGYNFEDSILLSERLVTEDVYTSVHIETFELFARDTKLGKEEVTRDIPNVGEDALRDLDDSGVVRIGAEVSSGDILVGKVTPKGETQLSPEEKLLRAIFGDKAGDVKDTSLRMPPGAKGTVIDVQIFSREGVEKDARAKEIEDMQVSKLLQDQEDQIKIIRESSYAKIANVLSGEKVAADLKDNKSKVLIKKGTKITQEALDEVPRHKWKDIALVSNEDAEKQVLQIFDQLAEQTDGIKHAFDEKILRIKSGDDLLPGVIKMVRVFVAIKRRISVGDKMAGRHGNKGVVSRIMPVEDMPYLEDGTPVDVVLNPLGVPSRMNVGQIMETHLGWAGRMLGRKIDQMIEEKVDSEKIRTFLKKVYHRSEDHDLIDKAKKSDVLAYARRIAEEHVHLATPVFDGANDEHIKELLKLSDVHSSGQSKLFDGRTGDAFDRMVTVGIMYVLKLHHLVDDKLHARSIGPYSLVTQQPLGGKAQFGGQRLGEMEVWALEAYGAAYALQEFLTVKSDDIAGRTRTYEAIVKGENHLECGLPESFNVLLKELKALSLDVRLIESPESSTEEGSDDQGKESSDQEAAA